MDYTATELSNADDRLSALAGIALLAYDKLSLQASYGLWLEYFLENLLWSADHPYVYPRLGHTGMLDLMPSWSWASTESPVAMIFDVDRANVLYSAHVTKFPPATPFARTTQLSLDNPRATSGQICSWVRVCQIVPGLGQSRPRQWFIIPTTKDPVNTVEAYVSATWESFKNPVRTTLIIREIQRDQWSGRFLA
jgi:hypothetical protein